MKQNSQFLCIKNSLVLLTHFFVFFFLANHKAAAQGLEYWKVGGGNLIFEEHLVGRDIDYYTITLSVRYRGEENKKHQLISQRKIKSPSPQDCSVVKVAPDTIYVEKYASQDLVTYKIKKGSKLQYLRPVYNPLKQWIIQAID
jgi:hypothetical protein